MSTTRAERSRLGELLVEMRLVDEAAMNSAMTEHRQSGRRLARILAERRLLDEERLTRAIAARLKLEAVSVAGVRIHERVLGLVPASVALAFGVLPIAVKRTSQAEHVYLVMADPLDAQAIAEVQKTSRRQVRVLVAKASELDQAIASHYGAGSVSTSGSIPPSEAQVDRSRRGSVPPVAQARTSSGLVRSNPPLDGGASRPGRLTARPTAFVRSEVGSSASFVAEPPALTAAAPAPLPVRRVPGEGESVRSDDLVHPQPLDGSERADTRIDNPFSGLDESARSSEDGEWERSVREWEGAGFGEGAGEQKAAAAPSSGRTANWGSAAAEDDVDGDLTVDAPPISSVEPATPASHRLVATALEIPVNLADESHPFDGPALFEIPVGLERTAIIPASELTRFEPPPLEDPGVPSAALAGQDDIPTSVAAIEARFAPPVSTLNPEPGQVPHQAAHGRLEESDDVPDIEEVSLEPLDGDDVVAVDDASHGSELRTDVGSDSGRVPVLEPSQLVSLIDETDPVQEDTGANDRPFLSAPDAEVSVPTERPGPAEAFIQEPMSSSDPIRPLAGAATTTSDSQPRPKSDVLPEISSLRPGPALASDSTRHATSMVASLRSGASLSSSQRAQLVLALGRLLLDKGVITEAELLRALLE